MRRLRQHELGDSGTGFELDGVVHLQQALAAALVAGVPDGRIQHTGVAKQRRPGVEETDVALRNHHPVGVLDDVATTGKRVDAVLGR